MRVHSTAAVAAPPADKAYWLAFHRIPSIGRVRFTLLQRHFGTLDAAWKASSAELKSAGLDPKVVATVVATRPTLDPEKEVERLTRFGVTALLSTEAAYPARLREINDAPPVLYYKGDFLAEDEWAVTVVGTRRITPYGREVTRRLCADLASHNVAIVSGLAAGVDAIAHQAAIDAGGRTIAVQACGLDQVYPAAHVPLAKQIARHGAILSDYPLGTKPKPEFFPRRNRILAGLTMGTLVVEAPEHSGALITAAFATEEGRDVFAVPGSILSPASAGTNRLLQEGAKLIATFTDIMEELNFRLAGHSKPLQPALSLAKPIPHDPTEARLLRLLSDEPAHVDEIRRLADLPIAEVSGLLAMLELKGLVKQVGVLNYVRATASILE